MNGVGATIVHHLTTDELTALSAEVTPPCLSIYLPTHRQATGTAEDRTRLRALLTASRAALRDIGLGRAEADDLLAPARTLLDDAVFWQRRGEGLALLLATERFDHLRLPYPTPELTIVGERFHLHPLAELLTDERILLLTLSQQRVRLLQVGAWTIEEVEAGGLPQGIDAVLPEGDRQTPLQLRRASAGAGDAAFFHGHGGVKDVAPDRRRRYLLLVDEALHARVGADRPLVVAGDRGLVAEFQTLTSHRRVLGELHGNHDVTPPEALHDGAWTLAAQWLADRRRPQLERLEELAGTGLATRDAEEVAAAAALGRVASLFLRPATDLAGLPVSQLALVDDAFVHTLRHGGEVVMVTADELDAGCPCAAILRY